MYNKQVLTHFIVLVPGFLPCKPFILVYYLVPLHVLPYFTPSVLTSNASLGILVNWEFLVFHLLWLRCLKGSGPCCGASCLLGQGDLCPCLWSWIRTPLGAAAHPPTEGVSSSFQLSVPGHFFSVAGAGCLWLSVYLCTMRLKCLCTSVIWFEEAG